MTAATSLAEILLSRSRQRKTSTWGQTALLSLVEVHQGCALIGWIMMLLKPALLCHKDTAQGDPSPLLEAFG